MANFVPYRKIREVCVDITQVEANSTLSDLRRLAYLSKHAPTDKTISNEAGVKCLSIRDIKHPVLNELVIVVRSDLFDLIEEQQALEGIEVTTDSASDWLLETVNEKLAQYLES